MEIRTAIFDRKISEACRPAEKNKNPGEGHETTHTGSNRFGTEQQKKFDRRPTQRFAATNGTSRAESLSRGSDLWMLTSAPSGRPSKSLSALRGSVLGPRAPNPQGFPVSGELRPKKMKYLVFAFSL